MGAAFVALLLLSGDLGVQAGAAASKSHEGELPIIPGSLGLQASVTTESRGGEAPVIPGQATQAFVAEILTPLAELDLLRPATALKLTYAPRIFWEDPNPAGTWRPLVLHTADLTLDSQLARTVSLLASATGSVGKPDYSQLPLVLGTAGQGSLPPVVTLESGQARALLRVKLTRRWDLDLKAEAFHWRWLDAPKGGVALSPSVVTRLTTVSVEPGTVYHLSARDDLGFATSIDEGRYSTGAGLLLVTPAASWKTLLTPSQELKIILGVTYGRDLGPTLAGTQPLLGSSGSSASPIGSFEFAGLLMRHEEFLLRGLATGGVDYYVDPILETAVRRALVAGGLTAGWAPDWMASLRGDFATALRSTPYRPGVSDYFIRQPGLVGVSTYPPDETAFTISLSIRRRISENLFVEWGGLWGDRAPALVTPGFQFHQRQLWVFVSLTGTTRPVSREAR